MRLECPLSRESRILYDSILLLDQLTGASCSSVDSWLSCTTLVEPPARWHVDCLELLCLFLPWLDMCRG